MLSSRRHARVPARVLCCHRGVLSATGDVGPGMLAAQSRSFLNRSGWQEFRAVLAGLRRDCPPALPVVIRTSWLPETILGQCLRRDKRFVVLLNDEMGEPQAVETLLHEWAHALAWNFALDRLAKAPDTTSEQFQAAAHDEAWGIETPAGHGEPLGPVVRPLEPSCQPCARGPKPVRLQS